MSQTLKSKKAVQAVLLNKEGQVLAVSRKTNHNDFGLIGGKVDPEDKDDLVAAIKREVKEETGLDIHNIKLIYTSEWDARTQYTFLADWSGEIYTTEPHVVKWTGFQEIINGTFGDFNIEVAKVLNKMDVKFVF